MSQEFVIPNDPRELWDADASDLSGMVVCRDYSEEFQNSENRLVHHAEGTWRAFSRLNVGMYGPHALRGVWTVIRGAIRATPDR